MKKLLALFLVLFAASSFGEVKQNYFTYSTSPGFTNGVYHNGAATFYPTLNAAVSAAAAGDYIWAAPQVHTISNALVVPVGATLDLRGATLNSYVAPLGTAGPTIIVRDNCRVLGGFVDLKLRGPAGGPEVYQGVIGSHRNVNTGTATNVWVYDNAGVGETDCIFVRNTNKNAITFTSCNYTSKWDALAFFEAAHTISFFDTALFAVGPNAITGSEDRANCVATEGTATGSKIKFHGGMLVCSNGTAAIVNGAGGVLYEFHNVGITNLGVSTSFVGTTADKFIFDGTSVTSAECDDDFGSATFLWRPGKYVGEYYGNGAGLTNIPYISVNGRLWGTNATSGKVTNILGGVSVGASQIAITNGGAVVNLGTSPGMIRALNNGVSTLIDSNTITTGAITNTGGINTGFRAINTSGSQVYLKAGDGGFGVNSGLFLGLEGPGTLPGIGINANSGGIWSAIGASPGTSAAAILLISNRTHLGVSKVLKVDTTAGQDALTVSTNGSVTSAFTVTATNGYLLPQLSAIPSSVDLRSSSGNTNWLALNLGGDVALIKTNPAAASSYLTNWLTVQLNFVEGSTAGTSVSLTTATAANITSVALTPGTWDLTASIYFDFVGATVTFIEGAFNTTSATIPGPPPEDVAAASPNVTVVSSDESLTIPRRRVTITANTTYYLVGRAAFSAGSIDAYGKILATRVN